MYAYAYMCVYMKCFEHIGMLTSCVQNTMIQQSYTFLSAHTVSGLLIPFICFPPPLPLLSGNHQFVLCIEESGCFVSLFVCLSICLVS